jgi:hypothetical protein
LQLQLKRRLIQNERKTPRILAMARIPPNNPK